MGTKEVRGRVRERGRGGKTENGLPDVSQEENENSKDTIRNLEKFFEISSIEKSKCSDEPMD